MTRQEHSILERIVEGMRASLGPDWTPNEEGIVDALRAFGPLDLVAMGMTLERNRETASA